MLSALSHASFGSIKSFGSFFVCAILELNCSFTSTVKSSLERSLVMNRLVKDENPTLGQTSDTYDDTAVFLSGALRQHSNYTLGNLLTAVEASLGDSKQAEALKAIIRKEIYAMIERNQAEVYVRAKMQRAGIEESEIHFVDEGEGHVFGEAYTKQHVEEELK